LSSIARCLSDAPLMYLSTLVFPSAIFMRHPFLPTTSSSVAYPQAMCIWQSTAIIGSIILTLILAAAHQPPFTLQAILLRVANVENVNEC